MRYLEFRYVKRGNKKVLQQRVGAITISKKSSWRFWEIGEVELTWLDWVDVPTVVEVKND